MHQQVANILVVEDLQDGRLVLEALLENLGYRVLCAENGVQALEMARAEPPDLIISDILMPRMDGFTLLRMLRAQRPTPVIVVTAKDLTDDDRSRLSGGVERIVEKGALTAADLLEHVHSLVEKPDLAHDDRKG